MFSLPLQPVLSVWILIKIDYAKQCGASIVAVSCTSVLVIHWHVSGLDVLCLVAAYALCIDIDYAKQCGASNVIVTL